MLWAKCLRENCARLTSKPLPSWEALVHCLGHSGLVETDESSLAIHRQIMR
jgi:hypothetical protein